MDLGELGGALGRPTGDEDRWWKTSCGVGGHEGNASGTGVAAANEPSAATTDALPVQQSHAALWSAYLGGSGENGLADVLFAADVQKSAPIAADRAASTCAMGAPIIPDMNANIANHAMTRRRARCTDMASG
jgi:hypothetical protein